MIIGNICECGCGMGDLEKHLKDFIWWVYFWVKYPEMMLRRRQDGTRKYHIRCARWYLSGARECRINGSNEWVGYFEQSNRHYRHAVRAHH